MFSLVIPAWSGTPVLAEMAFDLAKQIKPMCDELIITEDGEHYPDLEKIADIYLKHDRVGHIQNLNLGIKASSGDFVGALDTDMIILRGSLRDLCIPGRIVCGEWAEQTEIRTFLAWFFVSDRKILEDPQWAIPEFAGHEGLDSWGINLGKTAPYEWSDKVLYSHTRHKSYGAKRKMDYEKAATPDPLAKEIDPGRHKQRMSEDAGYAKLYGYEEEGQS